MSNPGAARRLAAWRCGAREMAANDDVALLQMRNDAVEVVGPERAALAARLPLRREHEVIHDELRRGAEQVGERQASARAFELIRLVDTFPGQLAPGLREFIAQARKFFFPCQECRARVSPFPAVYDAMVGHVGFSSNVVDEFAMR